MLVWLVGATGVATGALGCVLLATNTRRAPTAQPVAMPVWRADVADVARDALATVKRLAAGIAPSDVVPMQLALHDVAQRCRFLRDAMPDSVAGAADVGPALDVAAAGADAEAARLSGVAVMDVDRRAFLVALRFLRDEHSAPAAAAAESRVRTPQAVTEVAPTFTVA